MKQIVHYDNFKPTTIVVGKCATVFPIDHPDSVNVSNQVMVMTSLVLSHDPATGEFETQNSKYVPFFEFLEFPRPESVPT